MREKVLLENVQINKIGDKNITKPSHSVSSNLEGEFSYRLLDMENCLLGSVYNLKKHVSCALPSQPGNAKVKHKSKLHIAIMFWVGYNFRPMKHATCCGASFGLNVPSINRADTILLQNIMLVKRAGIRHEVQP